MRLILFNGRKDAWVDEFEGGLTRTSATHPSVETVLVAPVGMAGSLSTIDALNDASERCFADDGAVGGKRSAGLEAAGQIAAFRNRF